MSNVKTKAFMNLKATPRIVEIIKEGYCKTRFKALRDYVIWLCLRETRGQEFADHEIDRIIADRIEHRRAGREANRR